MINLYAPTFRRVPFFVRSVSTGELGRRVVLHDYLDSNKRSINDTGQFPPTFSVDAYISGDNLRERAAAFENALNMEGVGELVLPEFGIIQVYAQSYRKSASQKAVGVYDYTLSFAVEDTTPARVPILPQEVYRKGDLAREAVQESFSENFTTPLDFLAQTFSRDLVGEVIDKVAAAYLNSTSSNVIGKIDSIISGIKRNIISLTNSPSDLAIQLFSGVELARTLGLWQELSMGSKVGYTFNESISSLPFTELEELNKSRINRNENARALNQSMSFCNIIHGYESAANASFKSADEIEEARASVEGAYFNLLNDDNPALGEGAFNALAEVRGASLSVLYDKIIASRRVVDFELGNAPAIVQAYTLYEAGTVDQLSSDTDLLRDLNSEQSYLNIGGEVRGISA